MQQHTVACTQGQLGRQRCPFFWQAICCAAWIWLTHSCSSAASASPTAPLPQRKSSLSETGTSGRLALAWDGQEGRFDTCTQSPKQLPAERYPPADAVALHQAIVAANDDGTKANLGCHIQDSIAVGLQAGRTTFKTCGYKQDSRCILSGSIQNWRAQAAARATKCAGCRQAAQPTSTLAEM